MPSLFMYGKCDRMNMRKMRSLSFPAIKIMKFSQITIFLLIAFLFFNALGFVWMGSIGHNMDDTRGVCPFSVGANQNCQLIDNALALTLHHIHNLQNLSNITVYSNVLLAFSIVLIFAFFFFWKEQEFELKVNQRQIRRYKLDHQGIFNYFKKYLDWFAIQTIRPSNIAPGMYGYLLPLFN